MANYCGVFTNQKCKNRELLNHFISFQQLSNLTCKWLDEMPAAEELFQRQALKITEHEKKSADTEQLIMLSSETLTKAQRKLDAIEQEILGNSLNLEILELFVNMLENRSTDLSPLSLDHIRYPIYNQILNLISLLHENQANMEMFDQEYQQYRGAYRQNFVLGAILDNHVKTLQNIETHLNRLERSLRVTDETFTRSQVVGKLNSLS